MQYPDTRIIVRDLDNTSNFASSAIFHIDKPDQQTEVTAPAVGTTYRHHDCIDVAWSGFSSATVMMALNGGGCNLILESIPNTGSYSWLIPKTPAIPGSSDYKVLVYSPTDLEIAASELFAIQP